MNDLDYDLDVGEVVFRTFPVGALASRCTAAGFPHWCRIYCINVSGEAQAGSVLSTVAMHDRVGEGVRLGPREGAADVVERRGRSCEMYKYRVLQQL